MAITLYGRPNSINVQKVLFCLKELGVAYDMVMAGMKHGVNNTPEYKEMNPHAKVPTLIDGDLTIWESNSIVRHLAETYGAGSLWPADKKSRLTADMWMEWESSSAWPAMQPAFWHLVRYTEEQRIMAVANESVSKSNEAAAVLEGWLAENTFVAGDAISFGDMAVGPFVHRYLNMPMDRPATPHVQRYYDMLKERPSTEGVFLLPVG